MNEHQKEQQVGETPSWLEKLQQESWQAEILISGGASIGIIGLLSNLDRLESILKYSTKLNPSLALIPMLIAYSLLFFLAQGFLLHLILRGYWIGLIGMNYVFPKGINQEKLAFSGKFNSFIKVNSNTPYLIRLDKVCSLVFAFTFLVIFSFAGFLLFLSLIVALAAAIPTPQDLPKFIRIPLKMAVLAYLLTGIVVFIDFFTFGRLKRVRWFSKVYYPIHYFMSLITLSFLYRRLYYTIVSNIKPWHILSGFGIQILIVALLFTSDSSLSKDIKPVKSSDEGAFLSLKEDVVIGKSLQFSITHIPRLEEELFEEWKKGKKDTSIKSFEGIKPNEKLRLIGSAYEIYVDSVQIKNLQWMIRQQTVLGFYISKLVSVIDVSNLPKGSHQLIVRIRLKNKVDPNDPGLNYYAKAYFFIDI